MDDALQRLQNENIDLKFKRMYDNFEEIKAQIESMNEKLDRYHFEVNKRIEKHEAENDFKFNKLESETDFKFNKIESETELIRIFTKKPAMITYFIIGLMGLLYIIGKKFNLI